jgi:hypothetical protein
MISEGYWNPLPRNEAARDSLTTHLSLVSALRICGMLIYSLICTGAGAGTTHFLTKRKHLLKIEPKFIFAFSFACVSFILAFLE